MQGATAGATAGAALGPYGAAAGGVIGGALGYFGGGGGEPEAPQYDPDRNNYNLPGYGGMQSQYGGLIGQGPRGAPQAGQSGFRGNQSQLAGMLMGQAQGNGRDQQPSRVADDRHTRPVGRESQIS